MNIQDYASKIKVLYRKGGLEQGRISMKIYLAIIVILTAVASFGLGRLSVQSSSPVPVRIVNPTVELGAQAYSSADDGKKIKVTEPVIIGSISKNFYTFTWCAKASDIEKSDQRFFYSISEAEKVGLAPDLSCNGLK